MELRHLRYFVAVAEALNFTRAAARLRIAQPALSRQVQDLEDEIGVDLLIRSPRGVTLTAEGRLFLDEARSILGRVAEAVTRTQALARGEYGELHVGYAPSPSVELLPPALEAFQKAVPGVSISLHDLAGNELGDGLRSGTLHLAVMQKPQEENAVGLHFETLRTYPICLVTAHGHPLSKKRTVSVRQLAGERLVAFRRRDYADYHALLDRVLAGHEERPVIAVECDGASSLVTGVEARRGVAILPRVFARIFGARLAMRPLVPAPLPLEVGIARSARGDITPAGERFCQHLRAAAHSP